LMENGWKNALAIGAASPLNVIVHRNLCARHRGHMRRSARVAVALKVAHLH
jgi:hypothetical protein